MNVLLALQQYVDHIFTKVDGMKALLMDNHTIQIISMLYSMTEIIQKGVFLVQKIEDQNREILANLNAICILRPTKENMELLRKELYQPKYSSYHLFFTNFLDSTHLHLLSQSDIHVVIQSLQELYIDYMPINDDLFISNCPHFYSITSPNSIQNEQRVIDSLVSLLLALNKNPTIRYQNNSELCKRIGDGLSRKIDSQKKMFDSLTGTNLIILDRIFDPFTPLLTQWT